MTLLRHVAMAIAAGAVIVILSIQLGNFREYQMAEVAAYLVAIAGLTVLVGMSGQISIGHGAFMAIGGYVTALVLLHLGWPLEAVFAVSAAAAAAIGAVVGVAAARLRGPYLAGATLMLAVALPSLANRYAGVFGGDQGLSVSITTPPWLGFTFPPTRWLAWITWAAALITLILLGNVVRSRIGRSWRAIRDDEVAAALAGLNVARLQILAFVISSACAGLGGSLLAVTTNIVSPGEFTLALSITLLAGAVLGGLGSMAGALWGSLVLVFLPTYLTNVAASHGLNSAASSNVPIAVYGVVLIAVMILFPGGIQGGLRRFFGLRGPAGLVRTSAPPMSTSLRAWRRPTHHPPPAATPVDPEPTAADPEITPRHHHPTPASHPHEEGTA
jgi:branched-chain amino acid transport system permease protein